MSGVATIVNFNAAISASLNDCSDVPFARISHINVYATELTRMVYSAVFKTV